MELVAREKKAFDQKHIQAKHLKKTKNIKGCISECMCILLFIIIWASLAVEVVYLYLALYFCLVKAELLSRYGGVAPKQIRE